MTPRELLRRVRAALVRPRANLLGRSLVAEVTVTVDGAGKVRCAFANLDEDAPVRLIVEGLIASARRVAGEAERLAKQHGMAVTVGPGGEVEVVDA